MSLRRNRILGGSAVALLAVCLYAADAFATPSLNPTKSAPDDPKVRMLIQSSQRAYDRGELIDAIFAAKTAVHVAPESGSARLQLGICLMQAGDAYNAEDQLRRALFLGASRSLVLPHLFEAMLARGEFEQLVDEFPDPENSSPGLDDTAVFRARALALEAMSRPADANAEMDRAFAVTRNRENLIVRAGMALDQGDVKLAKNLSDEVLAANPKDGESLDLRVRVAIAMHDAPLALSTADELVSLNPKSLNARFTRLKTYLAENMNDKARAELNYISGQFPDLLIVTYYRALLQARSGDVKGAWKTAMMLPHEFNESDAQFGTNVAEMAAQSGHFEPAAAILHDIIAKWPNDLEARLDLVSVRIKQNNLTDALSVLQPLEDSTNPVAAMYFARIFTALRRTQDAQKYFKVAAASAGSNFVMSPRYASEFLENWLEVRPDDINVRRQYASLLMQQGNTAGAQTQYEKVLQQAPNDVSSLNNLGWLLQKSEPKRALALVSQAAKLAPNAPNVLDTQGWIEYGQRNNSAALDALQRAHTLKPDSPAISYHLAQVLYSLRRVDEARALLKAALADASANFIGRDEATRLLLSMH